VRHISPSNENAKTTKTKENTLKNPEENYRAILVKSQENENKKDEKEETLETARPSQKVARLATLKPLPFQHGF
jgi:hypothetical protein